MIFSFLVPKSIKIAFREIMRKRYGYKNGSYQNNYREFYGLFLEKRKEAEKVIPKVDLDFKHIENLVVLKNRIELLKRLPQNAVCSEVGVNEGEFSEQILHIIKPKKLHLIDAWGDVTRYHDGLKLKVAEKFALNIESQQIEINVGLSTDVLKTFPDNYFDWVYLDTDHTYKTTASELNILKNKVKIDGIIAGHDYIIGNWMGDCRYGVIEAVNELCVNDNWEIVYITINKNEMPSFAMRRIQNR
ncbi:MAG TPA: class I SAM-dependent methyltransferase [Hanamia sp.]